MFTINTVGDLPFGNALWFLTSLFFVEVIFSLCDNHIKGEKKLFFIIVLICGFGYVFSFFNVRLLWGIDSALTSIGFYYLGYLINKYKLIGYIDKSSLKINMVIFFSAFIGIFINGYVNIRTISYSNIVLFYLNASIMCILLIKISMVIEQKLQNSIIKKEIIFIGVNSLVYLVFNQIVIVFTRKVSNILFKNTYCIYIITFFVVILVLKIIVNFINVHFGILIGKSSKKSKKV